MPQSLDVAPAPATIRTKRRRRSFGAVRRLPSGRFQARYVGPDRGHYVADHTFPTEARADRWLAGVRADIDRDRWVSPTAQREAEARAAREAVAFADFAGPWVDRRQSARGVDLRPRTKELYRSILRRDLLPTFGETSVRDITPAMVKGWRDEQGKDHPTRTAHAYSLLRSILGTAVEDEVITVNPCRIRGAGQAQPAKARKPATVDELATMAGAMPGRLRLAVPLAAYCALRSGELRELRRRDVDLSDPGLPMIRVERGVTMAGGVTTVGPPKSAAGVRAVAVPPHLAAELAGHLDEYAQPGPDGLLFWSPRKAGRACRVCDYPGCAGGHMIAQELQAAWAPAREAAGRPDLRWHDLRHTGATWATQHGATLREVMARLGHSTPSAAMRYQHAVAERDRELARKLLQAYERGGS